MNFIILKKNFNKSGNNLSVFINSDKICYKRIQLFSQIKIFFSEIP